MKTPIYVIGSSNTDMVIKANKLPRPGETVIGGTFLMNPGGKGANQAVTAAKLGGDVKFIAKVGNDIFAKQAIKQFERENIDTSFVQIDDVLPSGVAMISVDQEGENCIIVAPGANNNLSVNDVEKALNSVKSPAIVLLQLEIPMNTVEYTVDHCEAEGLQIILNPAPAQALSEKLLRKLTLITPNETEAELLTGIPIIDVDSAREAGKKIFEMGVPNVVITLGSKGALVYNGQQSQLIPSPTVTAKDTTAAGDCFNGSLAVALSENKSLEEAVMFACKTASISVTRMGAQSSLPYRKEVDDLRLLTG